MIPDELNQAITEMLESAKPRDYREKLANMGIPHKLIVEVAIRHNVNEIHASQLIMRSIRKQVVGL